LTENFEIVKFSDGALTAAADPAVREVPLTIVLDGRELATLLASPHDLKELACGFLFASGLINSASDLKSLTVDERKWTAFADLASPSGLGETALKRLYTPGCGKGTLYYSVAALACRAKAVSRLTLSPAEVTALAADLHRRAAVYLETGGTHAAALAGRGGIELFREDIGRHNALDKVIGARLLAGGNFRDAVLLSSGRVSSDALLKAGRCGAPFVIARGAPTSQAVRLAREAGITLIGFARGRRFNIYSGAERVAAAAERRDGEMS